MEYKQYEHFIYKVNVSNLRAFATALKYIYDMFTTSQLFEISLINEQNKYIYELIKLIKINHHEMFVLSILKYCIRLLHARTTYESLSILNTECGKIIVVKNQYYDCSLREYMRILREKCINGVKF